MAETSNNSSTFTYVAVLLAVLIVAAAGLMYVQSGSSGGTDSSQSTFAALSQGIPLHVGEALWPVTPVACNDWLTISKNGGRCVVRCRRHRVVAIIGIG